MSERPKATGSGTTGLRIGDDKRANPPATDPLQDLMGHFGRYHLFLFLLVCLCKIPIALHQLGILFLKPKITYYCYDTKKNDSCPCENPIFDTRVFTNTIESNWKLICDRSWQATMNQTLFQLGTLIGSMVFGALSDRFGRKKPILIAVLIQILFGIVASPLSTYIGFTFCRFLIGLSVGGTMVISFVILMEFSSARHREILSALYQVPFNLGHFSLAIFAYFLRDFRHFQFAISLPALVLLLYFCYIWETPRWLLAMKKTDKAIKVMERVAKINRLPTDNIAPVVESYQQQISSHQVKKGTMVDLFRTPNIRKNIIAMSYNWFTCSYVFYGVSQYVGQLSGNTFLNVACGALVTLCGTLISIPLMKITGRKKILICSNFACAAVLFILAINHTGTISVVCACIGQMTSFIVFVVVYLYGSELFPTVVRNAAIGFSSMMARVGSMIAPSVIDTKAYQAWLPPLIFGLVPLVAGFVSMLLPETKGCALMTTIEEGEAFGKKTGVSAAPKT